MPEKKVSTPAADAPAAEGKTRKFTDIIDRAKADYRTTHKVGVQSCKVYVKPEEGAAYYVINKFSGKLEL